MSGRTITPQRKQAVLDALKDGKTHTEIINTLHISNPIINKIIAGECIAKESQVEEQNVWEAEFRKDWEDICNRIRRRPKCN